MKSKTSNALLNSLFNTSVNHFLASLVFALLVSTNSAHAHKSCYALFNETPKIKTDVFEKSFSENRKKHEKHVDDIINDPKFDLVSPAFKAELKDRLDYDYIYDKGLLGPLGKLFDLKTNPATQKIEITKNKYDYQTIAESNKALIERIKLIDNRKYDQVFESSLLIENLTDNTVLVQLSSRYKHDRTELNSAVSAYFQNMYYKMVNWKYRSSGLMENETKSSLLMMDDVSVYAKEEKYFDFSLVFDKKVWETQKSILTERIDLYHRAETDLQKNIELNKINDPTDPFMPMAGIAQAVHSWFSVTPEMYKHFGLTPVKHPVELKRYFKNEMEDPLNLLSLDPRKDEFLIRNKMIYKTVERLPVGTALEIHAHTDHHVDAYAKWGFVNSGLIKSEKFKDAKVHLLEASREEMLLKLKAIIDKNQ